MCWHSYDNYKVRVHNINDVDSYHVEILLRCRKCGEKITKRIEVPKEGKTPYQVECEMMNE